MKTIPIKMLTLLPGLVFFCNINAQDKELKDFTKILTDFNECRYRNECVKDGKVWHENIAASFRKLILTDTDEIFKESYNDVYRKYSIDSKKIIYRADFSNNGKSFSAYSYKSDHANRYFVVDHSLDTVVYSSGNSVIFVDGIFAVDEQHYLIIQNSSDSKSASVYILTKDKKWENAKAFRGEGFGMTMSEPYHTKTFGEERKYFELDYRTAMTYPAESRKIFFNPETKILSYRQYSDETHYKVISSEWKNKRFDIDDFTYEDPMKTRINLKIN
ncbi:hypothetical protein ODZ84_01695 [Chryseobacterium fluminis]|uniref:hypothetical protein n=1 Tax=Chryseobacterium fluminis TaxID=2983606 RepID=UPI00225AA82D|nr:hypothetical protein [Chryseobacterium sp. MMS21-Ot14]UZT98310.1 hypothetical protein ODZ84_01695 [Chryseobacterium sp. MMS21-Ot14]